MKIFEVQLRRLGGIFIAVADSLETVCKKYPNAYTIRAVYNLKVVHIIKNN